MEEFKIDERFLTDVPKTGHMKFVDVLTGQKYEGKFTGVKDHPEFDKLRRQLGEAGFIHVEPSWWNGDRVLKKFKLNGKTFNVGDQFPCASALQNQFAVERARKK